jgi:hypothetical protein
MKLKNTSSQYLYLDGNEKLLFSMPSGWIPAGSVKDEDD